MLSRCGGYTTAVLLVLLLPVPAQDSGGAAAEEAADSGDQTSRRPPVASPCEFPTNWRGEYFQGSLREPFVLTTQNFGPEGLCYRGHADGTFIIFNRAEKCYKCLRVWERHKNVLEYKLGTCRKYESPGEEFCTIQEDAPYR